MTPEAIAERIATVGQLYRVCVSLASARPLPPAGDGPPLGIPGGR